MPKDVSLSEEIVDDALFYLWEHRLEIEITYSIRTYLMRAVHNRCLNELNSLSHREELRFSSFALPENMENMEFIDTVFVSDDHPLGLLLEQEPEGEIAKSIEALPDECRTVFKKSRFEEKKYDEIATELNISVNTVKYHIKKRIIIFPISCKIATDRYTGADTGDDRSRLFRDDYLIRLPETILLRAEIKWRTGDLHGAAGDVNLLRARARCDFRVQASDVDLDLILDERAREPVYEERRRNTLLRMGGTVAIDRIRKYAWWDGARTSLAGKNFNLRPIPQAVIDTNKDAKPEQNPGW